jgi:hypothetical protein
VEKMIKTILLILLMIPTGVALSENLRVSGQIDAWHDGAISDRASGTGVMEYAAEGYPGGFSSGFNLSDGQGSYFFDSGDYSIRLSDFSGSIVAESDSTSTTADGNGTGSIKTKSYDGSKMGLLVSGMPSGELNGRGVWVIHASTGSASYDNTSPNLMDTNETESKPAGNFTPLLTYSKG